MRPPTDERSNRFLNGVRLIVNGSKITDSVIGDPSLRMRIAATRRRRFCAAGPSPSTPAECFTADRVDPSDRTFNTLARERVPPILGGRPGGAYRADAVNRFAIASRTREQPRDAGSQEASTTPALQALAEDLWTSSAPHRWIGLHLGTRMTVIRLSSGRLLLHSPVPITSGLRAEIAALGSVAHIVCPNRYHPTYA